jgi:hypothetical protein
MRFDLHSEPKSAISLGHTVTRETPSADMKTKLSLLLAAQFGLAGLAWSQTPSVIEFATNAVTTTEGGWANVLINCKPPAEQARVTVAASDGSAIHDLDYRFLSSDHTVGFQNTAGAYAWFNMDIPDDGVAEGDETFTLTLQAPTGGAVLGRQTNCVVTIKNLAAHVYLDADGSVPEGGTISMRVLRIGDIAVPFTVAYEVAGGTATEGRDFKPFKGVLDFTSHHEHASLMLPQTPTTQHHLFLQCFPSRY